MEYLYGIDVKIRSMDVPFTSGSILFEFGLLGSASMDFNRSATPIETGGVFLLLDTGEIPEDMISGRPQKLDLFFLLSDSVPVPATSSPTLDMLAKAEMVLKMTPQKKYISETSSITPIATTTVESIVFHGKGCSTMVGYITLSIAVVRLTTRHSATSAPKRISAEATTGQRVSGNGIGMLAAVEFRPPEPLPSALQLQWGTGFLATTGSGRLDGGKVSGQMNIIATKMPVSAQVDNSTQIDDLHVSIDNNRCLTSARKKPLRPPKISRSTDTGPVTYYIERDQHTGVERSMQYIPGYAENKDDEADRTLDKEFTSGRFNFSVDNCAHHPLVGSSICVTCVKRNIAHHGTGGSTRPKSAQASTNRSISQENKGKSVMIKGSVREPFSGRKATHTRAGSAQGLKNAPASKIRGNSSAMRATGRNQKSLPPGNKNIDARKSSGLNSDDEEHRNDEMMYKAPKLSSVFMAPPLKGRVNNHLSVKPSTQKEDIICIDDRDSSSSIKGKEKPSWWPLAVASDGRARPLAFLVK